MPMQCPCVCVLGVPPVYAQGTQAEHCDAHRGFLDEGHQLADVEAKRPVLRQQLITEKKKKTEQNVMCLNKNTRFFSNAD